MGGKRTSVMEVPLRKNTGTFCEGSAICWKVYDKIISSG